MTQILSDLIVHSKFARYRPEEKRRETWDEITQRNLDMHLRRFPQLPTEDVQTVKEAYERVRERKVLPSMRSMQLAGRAIERHENRIYNCSYLPIDDLSSFAEIMFLLLGGSGVGYSVQRQHVAKLPPLRTMYSNDARDGYVIPDDIEGWAATFDVLIRAYHDEAQLLPQFNYNVIRPKGSPLVVTGGKAPGPEPLRRALMAVELILHRAVDGGQERLTSLQCHDILCLASNAVYSGGIRRAALIALFSPDDTSMMQCKSGAWWETHPHRARANNSVVLLRSTTTRETFDAIIRAVRESHCGEPGIFWTHDLDVGTNPCGEISLRASQSCNLCDLLVSDVETQEELERRVVAATVIGTLQATYTRFPLQLRDIWRQTCEEDALLGVSLNGLASIRPHLDLAKAAQVAVETNRIWSTKLGIRASARLTCVKPSGDSSLVLGCGAGIHPLHAPYYLRRIRINDDEPVFAYLRQTVPQLLERNKEDGKSHEWVLSVPVAVPEGSVTRTETALEFLERVRKVRETWVQHGHVRGVNMHNVSATVSVRPEEWDDVSDWMWEHRMHYNGLTLIDYDGGKYKQAPYKEITTEKYREWSAKLKPLDFTAVHEEDDATAHNQKAACAGGACAWNGPSAGK